MKKNNFTHQNLFLDLLNGTVQCDSQKIPLRPLEAILMNYFLENSNRVIMKSELIEMVWKGLMTGNTINTLNVHMSRLRKKINQGFERKILLTLPKLGYMMRKV